MRGGVAAGLAPPRASRIFICRGFRAAACVRVLLVVAVTAPCCASGAPAVLRVPWSCCKIGWSTRVVLSLRTGRAHNQTFAASQHGNLIRTAALKSTPGRPVCTCFATPPWSNVVTIEMSRPSRRSWMSDAVTTRLLPPVRSALP